MSLLMLLLLLLFECTCCFPIGDVKTSSDSCSDLSSNRRFLVEDEDANGFVCCCFVLKVPSVLVPSEWEEETQVEGDDKTGDNNGESINITRTVCTVTTLLRHKETLCDKTKTETRRTITTDRRTNKADGGKRLKVTTKERKGMEGKGKEGSALSRSERTSLRQVLNAVRKRVTSEHLLIQF